MKSQLHLIKCGIILLLTMIACGEGNKQFENRFVFELKGEVKNGDGIELALYLPSEGLDTRHTITIQNGKYLFKFEANQVELAELNFEEDIKDDGRPYSTSGVIVEPGEVILNFTIEGKPGSHFFGSYEIVQGENNKFIYDRGMLLGEAMSVLEFGDSLKQDSMRKHVHPEVKKRTLDTYETICEKGHLDAVCLILLRKIVEGLNGNGPFQRKDLTDSEIERLRNALANVETGYEEYNDYRFIQKTLEVDQSSGIVFQNFTLRDFHGDLQSLEEICKRNKYTILDFWWSGCAPCRSFNANNREIYNEVLSNGIEIVGINVDDSQNRWLRTSTLDGIQWVNLYAGNDWEIKSSYGVTGYPTKLVFDSELKYIPLKFRNMEDFIDWSKQR